MRILVFTIMLVITGYLALGHDAAKLRNIRGMLLSDNQPALPDDAAPSHDVLDDEARIEKAMKLSEDVSSFKDRKFAVVGGSSGGEGDEEGQSRSKVKLMMNPLMVKMMNFTVDDASKWAGDTKASLERINTSLRYVLLAAPALVLILMLLLSKTSASGYAYLVARFGEITSKTTIFFLSIAAIIVWFAIRYNSYQMLDGIFLFGPTSLLVFSAMSLKIYDMNSPFWNGLIFWGFWQMCTVGMIIATQKYLFS